MYWPKWEELPVGPRCAFSCSADSIPQYPRHCCRRSSKVIWRFIFYHLWIGYFRPSYYKLRLLSRSNAGQQDLGMSESSEVGLQSGLIKVQFLDQCCPPWSVNASEQWCGSTFASVNAADVRPSTVGNTGILSAHFLMSAMLPLPSSALTGHAPMMTPTWDRATRQISGGHGPWASGTHRLSGSVRQRPADTNDRSD